MTMSPTITRLLIANRAEIAVRIMRTAQARGIECVAVYSDPDAEALHVESADLAVSLGGVTSAQSYLDVDKILAAAAASGADAIHPGYGFLSENAAFAQAVIDAGLIWVGPPPAAIAAMAEKVPAKRLVAAAGVPLVPGAELNDDVTDEDLLATAAQVGCPLMVKASAGGGGKGMRVVEDAADVLDAVAAARREAASAFGDATVFLERYLPTARHIEVQVFADDHGNVTHLFERECSIQRRHQKVIEEAPAAFLAPHVRDGLHKAAVAAAAAIDYRGAGTVEFLVADDDYYFLEMNTRLQVEHPVTEMITGLDLVALQLDVAEGQPLPDLPTAPFGHAIEARLYAEDPTHDDLPSVGRLTLFEIDTSRVRVDSGVRSGDEVSPYYDPMLAKVIAHATTRDRAAAALAAALKRATIHGVTTNRELLAAVLELPEFRDQPATTAFLTEHPQLRQAGPGDDVVRRHTLAAAAGWWCAAAAHIAEVTSEVTEPAWRNVSRPGGVSLLLDGAAAHTVWGGQIAVHRRHRRDGQHQWGWSNSSGVTGTHDDAVEWSDLTVAVLAVDDTAASVRVITSTGVTSDCRVRWNSDADAVTVWVDESLVHTTWTIPSAFAGATAAGSAGGPSAPVPGTVAAVLVNPGDTVVAGQALVVVEAMKMEHRICADIDAVVDNIAVTVGQSVDAHEVLVTLASGEPTSDPTGDTVAETVGENHS
jgi:propionyl-CoA carboxylase alpha chain